MTGLSIQRCRVCGTAAFPARIWCPTCRSRDWTHELATHGVVTETTLVRRAVGRAESEDPPRLATVVLDAGPPIVVGLERAVEPRTRVEIVDHDGAPWAHETE